MLRGITNAIASYCRTLLEDGQLLCGIKSVKVGNRDPFSIKGTDMPCLVVSQGPLGFINPRANEIQMKSNTVILSVYISTQSDIAEAEGIIQDLILSEDAESGLLKAMLLKRGYNVTVGTASIPITVSLQPLGAHENRIQFMYGARESAGYIYGARFSLTVTTALVLS